MRIVVAALLAALTTGGAAAQDRDSTRGQRPTPQAPDAGLQGPETSGGMIDFGDDSSDFALDGECDDRRFTGAAMALGLGWDNVGRDATDCRQGMENGLLSVWDLATALSATRCDLIDFGDDSSEYAMDSECDDPRFEGPGVASGVNELNLRSDATDCSRLCDFGVIGLRDYRSY